MKVGQRQSIYIILGMMILVLTACGSSEKDGSSGVRDSDHTERTTSSWEGEPEEENFEIREQKEQKVQSQQSKFSGVLWFQDDTGKNTQLHDGFLYAYWGNRLCRYNLETLEETVLYEALSAQTGDFCIYEGYVYFLVRRDVTFLDGPITMLYRVSCDGTELTKLQEFRIGNGYRLDAYDDILYLLLEYPNYDDEKNIYLRIGDDGVEQIPERETLYGILPEGYEADRQVVQYRNMPGLPYLMRNFGYMFLWDVEERLFRYAPESGVPELFELPEKAEGMVLYLISDSILFADKEGIWYRISLNDPSEIVTIDASCFEKGEELYGESFRYADENGLYFVKNKVGYVDQVRYVNLIRVSWEGKYERLYTYVEPRDLTTALHYYDEVKLTYFGGDYFYYNNITQGDGVILRVPLKLDVAEWEPEQVTVYYESPIKDISWYEKVVTEFHAEGLSGSFTVEETYLTDDSGVRKKSTKVLRWYTHGGRSRFRRMSRLSKRREMRTIIPGITDL